MAELVAIARKPARHTTQVRPARATTDGNGNGNGRKPAARRRPKAAALSRPVP